ncbi:Tn7-like element transposition protein TnsE [Bacillus sp. FSL R10-2201]|uniref:Tn7-like element transposition protein TnsE n=1 Tax=Bacillus sp. FSL R10-2201 TaxID=2954657 RepID=UPI0005358D76
MQQNQKFYIFEIATPDDKTLSTLIIDFTDEINEELGISGIIKRLVFNSGSWDKNFLVNKRFKRSKYISQSNYEWKKRLELNL